MGSTAKTESSWVSPPKQLQKKNSLKFTQLPSKNRSKIRRKRSLGKNAGGRAGGGVAAGRRGSSSPAPEHIARGTDVPSMSVRVCSRKLNSSWDDPFFQAEYSGENQEDWDDREADEEGGGGGVVTVSRDGRKIYCPDHDLVNIKDFEFDFVFPSSATSAKVYSTSVANLTPHVAKGGHACIIVEGGAGHAKVATALGRMRSMVRLNNDTIQESDLGIIHFAVAQVLSYLDKDRNEMRDLTEEKRKKSKKQKQSRDVSDDKYEHNSPSVTLTWYELLGREGIRDVLHAVSNHEEDGPTRGLNMHDTVGSGVHVPNLLEVEVKNVGDVHRVLHRIRVAEYSESLAGAPSRHSVLSVNVKQYNGRLDVILLGAPFKNEREYSDEELYSDSDEAQNASPPKATWSRELLEAVKQCPRPQVGKLVPSRLFDMSCLLLLLRESILGRIPSSWIVCVESTIDSAAHTLSSVVGAKLIHDSTRREKALKWDGYSGVDSSDDGENREDDEEVSTSTNLGSANAAVKVKDAFVAEKQNIDKKDAVRQSQAAPTVLSKSSLGLDRAQRDSVSVDSKDAGNLASESTKASQKKNSTNLDSHASSDPFCFAVSSKEMASFTIAKLTEISISESGESGMKAHQKKHLVKWFKKILKTSRENESEVRELKTKLETMQRRLRRANNSYAVLSSGINKAKAQQGTVSKGVSGTDSRSVHDLRAQLKKTQNELHDFSVYKDVMEATLGRVNKEMSEARAERDRVMAVCRRLKSKLKSRLVATKMRDLEEMRAKLSTATKEKQKLAENLDAERKMRLSAQAKAQKAEQQAENSADAVEMLASEQQRLSAELENANRKVLQLSKIGSPSSSPKFSVNKVEELQRSVAMLEARNTLLQRQLNQMKTGKNPKPHRNRRANIKTTNFAAPTTSSSLKAKRVKISLKSTPTAGVSVKAALRENVKKSPNSVDRESNSTSSISLKPEVRSETLSKEVAENSSRLKAEKDVQDIDDEEVVTALAALDDVGIVETVYESHGAKATENDVAGQLKNEEDDDISTGVLLERLRQKRMETHEFLNSRLPQKGKF